MLITATWSPGLRRGDELVDVEAGGAGDGAVVVVGPPGAARKGAARPDVGRTSLQVLQPSVGMSLAFQCLKLVRW